MANSTLLAAFIIVSTLIVLVGVLESVLYLAIFGPYYRFAPVVSRQLWRTDVSVAEADSAIEAALRDCRQLAFRRNLKAGTVYYFARKSCWRMSMWPAITLRIEDVDGCAFIQYEARPFLSSALFLPLPFLVPSAVFGLQLLMAGTSAFVVLVYAWGYLWEIPKMSSLDGVRDRLSPIGVRICRHCGYDLHSSVDRCPECATEIVRN